MDMTTQDRQLMASHDDLKLFGISRSEPKRDQLQDPLEGNVRDEQEHGFSPTERALFYTIELTHPSSSVAKWRAMFHSV